LEMFTGHACGTTVQILFLRNQTGKMPVPAEGEVPEK